MLTLDSLLELAGSAVCFVEREGEAGTPGGETVGMWPADLILPGAGAAPPRAAGGESLAGVILLTSPDAAWLAEPTSLLRGVRIAADRRVEALLFVPGSDRPPSVPYVPTLLLDAARDARIPVVGLSTREAAVDLLEHIHRHGRHDATDHGLHLESMLTIVRHHAASPVRTISELLKATAAAVGGTAALIEPDGSATQHPEGNGTGTFGQYAPVIVELRDGRPSPVSLEAGSAHIQLHATGVTVPHPVLAVQRGAPFLPVESRLLGHAATAIGTQRRLHQLQGRIRQREELTAVASLLTFRALMAGNVPDAEQAAEPLLPTLGRSGFVQVYLIEASASTRDALVDAYREALSEQALVIKCPAYNDHVIVLAEAPAGTGNAKVATRLRQLRDASHDSRRLLLGESRPTLIDRTSRAYGEALRALVAARSLPRYAATYRPSSLDLTQVLGADARRWAAQFLRPLFQLPPGSRTVTAGIVADALLFGTAEAARMTGVHRNTVASHLKEVGRRMELDLGRYPARAALVLALNLAPFPADPPPPGPAISLREVLADASCHDWAAELTACLKPELKRTLTAWIAADGRIDEALSARLGLHTNTIRKHLGRCEQLLSSQKPLIRHKDGAYEATLALHILGDLTMADFAAAAVP